MPTRAQAYAFALLCTLMIQTAFAQPATQRNAFPTVTQLNRFGLKMAWWNQASIDSDRNTVRHLTADEQIVYVQSSSGVVTAIDMETGKKLWTMQLGRKDAPSFPVTSNAEVALVLAGLDLYAIDKFSGNLQWTFRLPKQPSTSPVMDDEQVYVGTLDGSVYAANLKTIRELFEEGRLPEWSYQTIEWRYKTGGAIRTPPVPWGTIVNFASEDRSLYSVSKEERSLKFQLETDAPISAPMTQSDGYLYMASEDFNIYAVNLTNGRIRWQFVAGFPILSGPKAIHDKLYVAPQRGGLYQLSAVSGRQRWWRPDLTEFVAQTQHYVFATNQRGDLVILDEATGGPVGILPLRQFSIRVSNERTDRAIMATPSGLVIMLHEGEFNEIQKIALEGDMGTFTLSWDAGAGEETTAELPANATAQEVQAALDALPTPRANELVVSGDEGGPWFVSFLGRYAGENVNPITVNSQDLTGTVEVASEGSSGRFPLYYQDPEHRPIIPDFANEPPQP